MSTTIYVLKTKKPYDGGESILRAYTTQAAADDAAALIGACSPRNEVLVEAVELHGEPAAPAKTPDFTFKLPLVYGQPVAGDFPGYEVITK